GALVARRRFLSPGRHGAGGDVMTLDESRVLREFFLELVGTKLQKTVGISDGEVTSYLSEMLTEFCEADQLFKVRDAAGRQLHDVGEMLLEADPIYGTAPSFDRERQVRKHIGD